MRESEFRKKAKVAPLDLLSQYAEPQTSPEVGPDYLGPVAIKRLRAILEGEGDK